MARGEAVGYAVAERVEHEAEGPSTGELEFRVREQVKEEIEKNEEQLQDSHEKREHACRKAERTAEEIIADGATSDRKTMRDVSRNLEGNWLKIRRGCQERLEGQATEEKLVTGRLADYTARRCAEQDIAVLQDAASERARRNLVESGLLEDTGERWNASDLKEYAESNPGSPGEKYALNALSAVERFGEETAAGLDEIFRQAGKRGRDENIVERSEQELERMLQDIARDPTEQAQYADREAVTGRLTDLLRNGGDPREAVEELIQVAFGPEGTRDLEIVMSDAAEEAKGILRENLEQQGFGEFKTDMIAQSIEPELERDLRGVGNSIISMVKYGDEGDDLGRELAADKLDRAIGRIQGTDGEEGSVPFEEAEREFVKSHSRRGQGQENYDPRSAMDAAEHSVHGEKPGREPGRMAYSLGGRHPCTDYLRWENRELLEELEFQANSPRGIGGTTHFDHVWRVTEHMMNAVAANQVMAWQKHNQGGGYRHEEKTMSLEEASELPEKLSEAFRELAQNLEATREEREVEGSRGSEDGRRMTYLITESSPLLRKLDQEITNWKEPMDQVRYPQRPSWDRYSSVEMDADGNFTIREYE